MIAHNGLLLTFNYEMQKGSFAIIKMDFKFIMFHDIKYLNKTDIKYNKLHHMRKGAVT